MPRKLSFILLFISTCILSIAQKKPLDHSVYDSWQSIGEKMISNDGRWVVYTIDPQEGDNELVIQSPDAKYKKTVARGYNALITEDSRFVVFKIRPLFKDIREAKIRKKKGDESPKDSLAIIELGKDSVWKMAGVKDYKISEKSYGWLAYHMEKNTGKSSRQATIRDDNVENRISDSLSHIIDSLQTVVKKISKKKKQKKDNDGDDELIDYPSTVPYGSDTDDEDTTTAAREIVSDLILRNLNTGEEKIFINVAAYYFSKNGRNLLIKQAAVSKDSLSKALVLLFNLRKGFADTLSRGGNVFKNFAMTDDGSQVAFLAERDSVAGIKGQQRFCRIWYYKEGMDSAALLVDMNSAGMKLGMTVSEFGNLEFSKSGKRLFFGTSPLQPPEDTTLPDIDKVKLDIWHYNDDELQTVQLNNLKNDLQKNYLAVYHFESNSVKQLGSEEMPVIYKTNEGDGDTFVGVTDFGKRIESQWTGTTKKDIYAINVNGGTKKLVKKDLQGEIAPSYISPTGKYIMWYDSKAKNYFVWDGKAVKNITAKIKLPLWDEEYDSPSDPPPYGIMGWHEGDSAMYVYDRYDVWKVDPRNIKLTELMLAWKNNRKNKIVYRYVRLNPDERFISSNQSFIFKTFDEINKVNNLRLITFEEHDRARETISPFPECFCNYNNIVKSKDRSVYIYTKENFEETPNLFISLGAKFKEKTKDGFTILLDEEKLSFLNPQQNNYNWGTAELFKWKAYDGKESEGIVYKPEDFDPKKKYPLICYFYETLSDGLYRYHPPAPTPSRLNISFFVSRGYIVFAPDIHYTTGHPGRDAYNYVVSGARALIKKGFVDSTRIGVQGQSWGGYQVAYLITVTDLFKAAWAGAPVANMTSAYGGIRWETGLNRQFQYEKTQSRIGASLWDKPELYIENSPLFRLPKVKTPLVIMHNDKDGAVPWYQGIELFTAMRRLGKKVWLLNYNGEAHNLVERKNRKDISIREQQYFDWLLKGEKPAKWITNGVPAVKKGKDWGLELVD